MTSRKYLIEKRFVIIFTGNTVYVFKLLDFCVPYTNYKRNCKCVRYGAKKTFNNKMCPLILSKCYISHVYSSESLEKSFNIVPNTNKVTELPTSALSLVRVIELVHLNFFHIFIKSSQYLFKNDTLRFKIV